MVLFLRGLICRLALFKRQLLTVKNARTLRSPAHKSDYDKESCRKRRKNDECTEGSIVSGNDAKSGTKAEEDDEDTEDKCSAKKDNIICDSEEATAYSKCNAKAFTTQVSPDGVITSAHPKLDLSFSNAQEAFKSKKSSELVRAYFVYRICAINFLVERNIEMMRKMRKIFGKSIFEYIMRATFYGHFVAGEDQNEIKPVVQKLNSFGVKSILDYSVEEDLSHEAATEIGFQSSISAAAKNKDEGKDKAEESDPCDLKQFHVNKKFADRRYKVCAARTFFYLNEASCEKNMVAFLRSIEAAHSTKPNNGYGLMAVKLTALGRPQLLLQLSEVILRVRNYMAEFDGGTGNVLTHHKTIEDFQRYFEDCKDKPEVQEFLEQMTKDKKDESVIHLFPWSNILNEDLTLSDTFRLPDPKTGRMRRLISQITEEEEYMFRNMLRRLKTVIKVANVMNVRVMIDAEQTYFQPAISRITLEMMRRFNKGKFLVFNTHQTYLKNAHSELVADLEQARRQNFLWAAKLVRGAYIEQERARAAAMGYDDPTCPSKEATTASYHKCVTEILNRYQGDMKDRVCFMVASHNEDTVRFAVQSMDQLSIDREADVVCFGQLYGMCDHITFPLGQAGYSAYKYVAYGPVELVLPYLSRRANENRGAFENTTVLKERKLILTEIVRRIKTGQLFYKPVPKS